jgi:hypothetical protein
MEQEEKKVILPWDEYQELLKEGEALEIAKEELEKDCKERGLYVEFNAYFYEQFYSLLEKCINPRLSIVSKDAVLEAAAKEIDRLSNLAKSIEEEKNEEIARLKNRNLWERIFNKE